MMYDSLRINLTCTRLNMYDTIILLLLLLLGD